MKLGYTEEQIFDMTPRKFFRLFDEYQYMNGLKKDEQGIEQMP